MLIANAAQIREADRLMAEEFAYPTLLLMETAGRKAAEFLIEHYPHTRNFLILCGPGNNGGDGLVTARYLALADKHIQIVLAQPPKHYTGDALTNYRIVEKQGLPLLVYDPADVTAIRNFINDGGIVIDALLGTGSQGSLRDPLLSLVNLVRSTHAPVVALDLPSGLSADSGAVSAPPLKCEYTLTLQYPKVCHYVTPAAKYCGEVVTIDLAVHPAVTAQLNVKTIQITPTLIQAWYRPRASDAHKGDFGHALMVGGSKGYGGAIALTAQAASEIGAGLCTAFIPGCVACSFHRTTLENMSLPFGGPQSPHLNELASEVLSSYLDKKSVICVGPGLSQNQDTYEFLRGLLSYVSLPLILDADALNLLAEHPDLWNVLQLNTKRSDVIITPHPGEMARLMDRTVEEVQEKRLETALHLAATHQVIVVLKGQGTIIASPSGEVFICAIGNPGMAGGGTGDVLTGVISGLVAQGYPPLHAAAMGVYVHAHSGDMIFAVHGHEGVSPSKIIRNLGTALKEIREAL